MANCIVWLHINSDFYSLFLHCYFGFDYTLRLTLKTMLKQPSNTCDEDLSRILKLNQSRKSNEIIQTLNDNKRTEIYEIQ